MAKAINDPRIGINYYKRFRRYSIDLMGGHAQQQAFYCPFCGNKLPSELGDQYVDILKKEYNIYDHWDEGQTKLIPEEFKSDEWWKKRGL